MIEQFEQQERQRQIYVAARRLLRAVPVFPAGTDAPKAGCPGPSRAPQFPHLSGPRRAGQTASSGH